MNQNDVFEEMLSVYQALRRYGIAADHIFLSDAVVDAQKREPHVGFVVRVPGHPQWSCNIAPCAGLDVPALLKRWKREANTVPEVEFTAMWKKHMSLERFTDLCSALLSKGIPFKP